ncbi:uncharacterized protein LOC130201577 [Pseudoliparis swirei]|uniref:uncharacterized protein LOC130201577 n=1 Tax=Pseudoliparis swirei TaxID=2059687 RepID=UPI0024BE3E34|nr:uncharacterized protein LOC130201577 [Pseudoliparis swirei]
MVQDQAEAGRQTLGKLLAQAEEQTRALERLAAQTAAATPVASPLVGVELQKMTAGDDPQSFLETFETVAEACGWPAGVGGRLLPLLTGEAQTAALGLPPAARQSYVDMRKAVMDRLGLTRRITAEPGSTEGAQAVVEKAVVERFMEGLPTRTAEWVRCHGPTSLEAAITRAEDHLAVHPGGQGDSARAPARPIRALTQPIPAPVNTGTLPNPQVVPQTPGQACWRCRQPGHIRRECPLMEVGQVIRVAGSPTPSPGPGATYRVPDSAGGARPH